MASDLDLHCLPMSHKKDARIIWVKKHEDKDRFNLHLNGYHLISQIGAVRLSGSALIAQAIFPPVSSNFRTTLSIEDLT